MVDGYRLDPAGVNAVVTAVVASAAPIGKAFGRLEGHATSAATGASSAIVGGALKDAFDVIGAQAKEVQAKIPAVLRGTGDAGRAIEEGDAQMASDVIGLATGALSETDLLRSTAHRGGAR